jgi:hypothetical protein
MKASLKVSGIRLQVSGVLEPLRISINSPSLRTSLNSAVAEGVFDEKLTAEA